MERDSLDAVKAEAKARGIDLNRIGGIYHAGEVILNAKGLESPARAAEVFFHEQAGHHGVSKILEGISEGSTKKLGDILKENFPAEWQHVSERYHPHEGRSTQSSCEDHRRSSARMPEAPLDLPQGGGLHPHGSGQGGVQGLERG